MKRLSKSGLLVALPLLLAVAVPAGCPKEAGDQGEAGERPRS
jgi:hypothetical protein